MTQFVFTNNASTTLTSAVGPTTTTFQVASGAAFPTPAVGQQFTIWMTDAATGQLHEVVYATANASNQFTVLRGQEGTTALSWAIGDIVQHNCTAGPLNTYADAYTVQAQAGNYATDTSGAANAIVVAYTPAITALAAGQVLRFQVAHTNTGDVTIAVNGLAAVPLLNPDGTQLYPGQIVAGGVVSAIYTGSDFVITAGSNVIEGASGLLTTIDANNGGQLRLTNGNYGFLLRNDGASAYLMQTASGQPLGTFNSLRPFAWALTTGQVTLDGTGAGVTTGGPVSIGGNVSAASGVFANMQVFGSSQTWTVPFGVTKVKVLVVGGGGGGSNCSSTVLSTSTDFMGGGGGAGGASMAEISGLTPNTGIPITVGAGGSPQANGGTSSFGSYASATGGSGTGFQTTGISAGGAGGVGSGPGLNVNGGYGGDGQEGSVSLAGNGGASIFGGGGRAASNGGSATAGQAYGSGGGGAYNSTSAAGGYGQQGVVVVWY